MNSPKFLVTSSLSYDSRFTIYESRCPFHNEIMTTAIVHHPIYKEHDTGPNHPETPARYSVVMKALRDDGALWPRLLELQAKEAAGKTPVLPDA